MRLTVQFLTLVLLVHLPLAWSAGFDERPQNSSSQKGVEINADANTKKRIAKTPECAPSTGDVPPIHIYTGVRSNSGWTVMLKSGRRLSKIETRPMGHSIWTLAQAYGDSFGAAFAELPPCAKFEVRATTSDGRALGPYVLAFDAMESLRNQAMQSVRTTPGSWAYLRAYPDENHTIVYFSHLVSYRCGLREVRYSIDSETLDKRIQLPPCSFDDPFRASSNNDDLISLPEKHNFVAVQVVYFDNSVSDVVINRRGSGG